jgi:phospholipid/cholesterol/gamma-HCH transport system substrate-binding protein
VFDAYTATYTGQKETMETRANYIIVGLFVIGLGVAFVIALLWFSAGQYKDYDKYLVYVNESVSGLSKQATVRFNGVDVGYVSDIELDPKDPQQVELTLNIAEGTPINQSTTATLMTQGITGITYVGLKAEAIDAKPLKTLPGNPYPIIKSEPSLLMQVDAVLREVTKDVKQINKAFQELLSEQNQKAIREILANAAKFTEMLADNSGEVDKAIKEATKGLQYGKELTQSLAQQTAPETTKAINRMTTVLTDLEQLLEALKQNPSMLIRGRAPTAPGPGE